MMATKTTMSDYPDWINDMRQRAQELKVKMLAEERPELDRGDATVRRGRPKLQLDPNRLRHLREEGWSLRRIARACGVGKDTVRNTLNTLSKNSQDAISGKKVRMGKRPGQEAGP